MCVCSLFSHLKTVDWIAKKIVFVPVALIATCGLNFMYGPCKQGRCHIYYTSEAHMQKYTHNAPMKWNKLTWFSLVPSIFDRNRSSNKQMSEKKTNSPTGHASAQYNKVRNSASISFEIERFHNKLNGFQLVTINFINTTSSLAREIEPSTHTHRHTNFKWMKKKSKRIKKKEGEEGGREEDARWEKRKCEKNELLFM